MFTINIQEPPCVEKENILKAYFLKSSLRGMSWRNEGILKLIDHILYHMSKIIDY